MKICHITYSFPPTKGGSETHNYTVVKYLLEKGYDVDVILIRKKNVNDTENTIYKGIRVHNISPKPFPFWIFQVRKEMKKIEKEGKVDVYDIHSIRHASSFIFQKKKIVYSLHFFELNCPGSRAIPSPQPCIHSLKKCWRCCGIGRYLEWKLIRWFVIRKTTKFMVKYDYMKKLAVKSGVKKDKIEVIPHWLDIEKNRELMRNSKLTIAGVDEHDKIFVHVGRLVPVKGIMKLLKAFNILIKEYKNAKLIFVGDGILRNKLEDFCTRSNINNNVIFAGAVQHDAVFKYLSLADCIISCQLHDNYGWALLECMCAGKPIIATNVGATSDILEDGYNALFAESTPKSLALKMKEILESPELGENLGKNALRTINEKHSLKNLEKYEELVRGVAG